MAHFKQSKDLQSQQSDDYKQVLQTLKERVTQAQHAALKAVNKELVGLYWDIGRVIVEKQEQYKWGDNVVEQLAKDLQAEFPGIRGFSRSNVFNVRQFYLTYKDDEKVQAVLGQISWTHHLQILRCKTGEEREFYLKMTRKHGWSYRVLNHYIDSKAYERWLLGQTNFDTTLANPLKERAKLAVRDDYNFDFLELAEPHLERELEEMLVSNI